MSTTVKIRRSGTASATPSALEHGEIAINYADGKVFWKDASNVITSFTFQSYALASHTHAASDITSGTLDIARIPTGSTSSTVCIGNDARLSDTRTPTDGSVSTAKIADDAVTYAKIQNVSATDRLLGRSSSGAGDVEEITCTSFGRSLIDDADAAAARTTLGVQPTASPAFTGAATFENTGNVVPLTVTNTGTANSFVVNDASGDTTPFVIDASGVVTCGGQVLVTAGSGSSGSYKPGLAISGDDDTGIQQVGGANTLSIVTDSQERVRVDASGNVAVGLTSTTYKLDINGNLARVGVAGLASYLALGRETTDLNNCIIGNETGEFVVYGGVFGGTSAERLRVDASGNIRINGAAAATSAVGCIHLKNGTAPTASITDGVVLFAADISSSSELRVRDEAGNVTTLSPHSFPLIPDGPSEPMAWAYYSERDGRRINVDMLRVVRLLEQLTGEKLVYEE